MRQKVEIGALKYRFYFRYQKEHWPFHPNRAVRNELEKQGIVLTSRFPNQMIGLLRRVTYCFLESIEGETRKQACWGYAVCRPTENFVKREGRERAFARCMSALPGDLLPYADKFIEAFYSPEQ